MKQDDHYYSCIREDIIEIAGESGSIDSVLDVGCGYGYTALRLKEIGAQKVEGIELSNDPMAQNFKKKEAIALGRRLLDT